MKHHLGYLPAMAAVVSLLLTCGCRQNENTQAAGPEDTVKAFCKAVAAGEFCTVKELCDTVAMKEYIGKHMQAWEMLEKDDSSSLMIAGEILSSAELTIEDVARKEDMRVVHYTISIPDGKRKSKTAYVKKEDDKWRVMEIADRN